MTSLSLSESTGRRALRSFYAKFVTRDTRAKPIVRPLLVDYTTCPDQSSQTSPSPLTSTLNGLMPPMLLRRRLHRYADQSHLPVDLRGHLPSAATTSSWSALPSRYATSYRIPCVSMNVGHPRVSFTVPPPSVYSIQLAMFSNNVTGHLVPYENRTSLIYGRLPNMER